MNVWQFLDAWQARRERRWIAAGSKSLWERIPSAQFIIALIVIGLFGYAYQRKPDETMTGALIAGFAGAWGYFLGSSRGAATANDRNDATLAIAHEALKQLPAPTEPTVTLKPGETAQAEPIAEPERKDA